MCTLVPCRRGRAEGILFQNKNIQNNMHCKGTPQVWIFGKKSFAFNFSTAILKDNFPFYYDGSKKKDSRLPGLVSVHG